MLDAQALIFDLDGTLVDTAAANYRAYAAALREVGVEVERMRFDAVARDRNWRDFLPDLLAQAGVVADAAAVAARKRALYPAQWGALRFNEGLLAVARLARATARVGLATTASAASVAEVLSSHGLAACFDAIVTGDDVRRHKPAPDAFLLCAERLSVESARCVVFENSDIGEAAARAAGMQVVRVSM